VTQPVQEPLTQRSISKLNWDTNQLYRRPDPNAAFIPACLRAFYAPSGGLTVGNGVESSFFTFQDWVNEDPNVFQEVLFSGDLQKVDLREEGIYTVTINLVWETDFAFPTGVLWLDGSTTASNWPFAGNGNMNAGTYAPVEVCDSFCYPVTMSITRKFPRFGTTAISGGDMAQVSCKAIQYSGVNKDLASAYLEIFYWGPTREPTFT
jgi:hypothetical protein